LTSLKIKGQAFYL